MLGESAESHLTSAKSNLIKPYSLKSLSLDITTLEQVIKKNLLPNSTKI